VADAFVLTFAEVGRGRPKAWRSSWNWLGLIFQSGGLWATMCRMKALLGLLCSFLVLGHGTALAQSQLSGCQGSGWDNCFDAWTNRATHRREPLSQAS